MYSTVYSTAQCTTKWPPHSKCKQRKYFVLITKVIFNSAHPVPTLYSQCQYFCPAPWRFRSLFVSLILQLLDLWWSDFQNSKFCMIFLGPFQIYKFFLCTTKTPDSTNFEKNIFKFSNFEFWKSNHHKLSNCNVNDTNKDRKRYGAGQEY